MAPDLWQHRAGSFDLRQKTLIMGVLNLTPDSFSDGGRYVSVDSALAAARQMLADGADIMDIGGESTRPGAEPVSAEEEISRVLPLISCLAETTPAILSIDTMKAVVADAALRAGAHIVNDVSGLTADPGMVEVVKAHRAGLVLMHMQGNPKTMQTAPHYERVVDEVGAFLLGQLERAVAAGIFPDAIVVDPGIGFGKDLEHNLELLRGLKTIAARTGRPVLAGVSRKRFIGAITGREVPERLAGSLAAAAFAMLHGARVLRVHDVKETCDVARMIDRLQVIEARG